MPPVQGFRTMSAKCRGTSSECILRKETNRCMMFIVSLPACSCLVPPSHRVLLLAEWRTSFSLGTSSSLLSSHETRIIQGGLADGHCEIMAKEQAFMIRDEKQRRVVAAAAAAVYYVLVVRVEKSPHAKESTASSWMPPLLERLASITARWP